MICICRITITAGCPQLIKDLSATLSDAESTNTGGSDLDDGFFDALQSSASTSGSATSSSDLSFIDPSLCNFCFVEAKIHNQKFCDACGLRVRRARSHAARQGRSHKKGFSDIVKVGDKALVTAVEAFEGEAMGFGRGRSRPFWDWCQYAQEINGSTTARHGKEFVWMSIHWFVQHMQKTDGMSEADAKQRFLELCDSLPPARVKPDKSMILYPEKVFVIGENVRAQTEKTSYGYKPIRKPGAGDFQNLAHMMGHGHQTFQDDMVARQLGVPEGIFQGMGPGVQSWGEACTALTEAGQKAADELRRKAEEDKERRKQARSARQQPKPFEPTSQTSIMRPKLLDKWDIVYKQAAAIVGKIKATIKDVDESPQLYGHFKDAMEMMKLRMEMLQAWQGDVGEMLQTNQDSWSQFITRSDVQSALQTNEPHPDLENVQPLCHLRDSILKLTLSGWDDLKDKKEHFEAEFKRAHAVLTHVSFHHIRTLAAITARNRKFEKEGTKKRAAIGKEAASVLKESQRTHLASMQAMIAANTSPDTKESFRIFEFVDSIPTEVESIGGSAPLTLDSAAFNAKPLLIQGLLEISETALAACDKFLQKFQNSDLYVKGRGSDMITQALVLNLPRCLVQADAPTMKSALPGADWNFLSTPWFAALAHDGESCGAEWSALASCKIVLKGQRTVILVEFAAAAAFVKSSMAVGSILTLAALLEHVKGADEAMLALLVQHVLVYKVHQCAGEALFIPWGFLAFEKADNGAMVASIEFNSLGTCLRHSDSVFSRFC